MAEDVKKEQTAFNQIPSHMKDYIKAITLMHASWSAHRTNKRHQIDRLSAVNFSTIEHFTEQMLKTILLPDKQNQKFS